MGLLFLFSFMMMSRSENEKYICLEQVTRVYHNQFMEKVCIFHHNQLCTYQASVAISGAPVCADPSSANTFWTAAFLAFSGLALFLQPLHLPRLKSRHVLVRHPM